MERGGKKEISKVGQPAVKGKSDRVGSLYTKKTKPEKVHGTTSPGRREKPRGAQEA